MVTTREKGKSAFLLIIGVIHPPIKIKIKYKKKK
jgi:hypothetical protein